MKIIAIGDVHNHWEKLESIVSRFPDHKIIQVGDIFDDFGDNRVIAKDTAYALKRLLKLPNYVQLFGNHDLPYCPRFRKLDCSGFTFEKYDSINEVLTTEDWEKFKFFYHENGWYFSHAGITRHWFEAPVTGDLSIERIEKVIADSIKQYDTGMLPFAIYGADYYRGGNLRIGGLVWCDWRALQLIPNMKQVVGHTPLQNHIIFKEDISIQAINVNIDCELNEVIEIDEKGNHSIIKV